LGELLELATREMQDLSSIDKLNSQSI
jgi:hypothetical protein